MFKMPLPVLPKATTIELHGHRDHSGRAAASPRPASNPLIERWKTRQATESCNPRFTLHAPNHQSGGGITSRAKLPERSQRLEHWLSVFEDSIAIHCKPPPYPPTHRQLIDAGKQCQAQRPSSGRWGQFLRWQQCGQFVFRLMPKVAVIRNQGASLCISSGRIKRLNSAMERARHKTTSSNYQSQAFHRQSSPCSPSSIGARYMYPSAPAPCTYISQPPAPNKTALPWLHRH